MVISFVDDVAFGFLEDCGYVATFRANRRKRPNLTTWANRGRGESKEFDVRVTELAEVDPQSAQIADFAMMSGFGDPESWREAIRRLNGDLPSSGWVYVVTTIGD